MLVIENDYLKVRLKPEGAELTGIFSKTTNLEYLWQGNPEYWRFHAPICFPIVGRLCNDTCYVNGQSFSMTVHGFARDMEFDVLNHAPEKIALILKSTENILTLYPFKFTLILSYELKRNKIIVSYEVINDDIKTMYFSIGAHTAFNCPIDPDLNMEDYYLKFEAEETIAPLMLNNGFLGEGKRVLYETTNKIPLAKTLFEKDVIILDNLKQKVISICTDKNNSSVKVKFDQFPYLAIWSKPTGAPFICIEPWFGLPDQYGESKELQYKNAMEKLSKNDHFKCSHEIVINP